MAICNCVYIVLLFTDITVFRTCGVLDITVLPYYVSLYYTDISLRLTGKPLVLKSIGSLRKTWHGQVQASLRVRGCTIMRYLKDMILNRSVTVQCTYKVIRILR